MLGALLLQPALARKADRSQPMRVVHADSFSGFNAPNSVTTLNGNVELSQGTLKITGDLAKIHVDGNQQLSRIVVTGNAHIQQLDDAGNLMSGDAHTLDYDNIKGIATLKGQASVHQQGRGEAHGDTLTYNTQTSEMTGSSGNDGGRRWWCRRGRGATGLRSECADRRRGRARPHRPTTARRAAGGHPRRDGGHGMRRPSTRCGVPQRRAVDHRWRGSPCAHRRQLRIGRHVRGRSGDMRGAGDRR